MGTGSRVINSILPSYQYISTPAPIPAEFCGRVFTLNQVTDVGAMRSEDPRLIRHEIIFKYRFRSILTYEIVVSQRYRRRNGRTDDLPWHHCDTA